MIVETIIKRPRIVKETIDNRIYDKLRELHCNTNTKFINAKYKMLMLNVEMKSISLSH
jgi:hypothetical protein